MEKAANSPTERQVPVVNLPNALTVVRIILVPVFVWLFLLDTPATRWAALIVFCVAGFTDQLDGYIARAHNLETDFGRLADPLADKALTLSAFIVLSINGPLPWFWLFTALVAVRELGITVLREVLRRQGTVISASSGGKLKTVLQMFLIFIMLIPWGTFGLSTAVGSWLFWSFLTVALITLAVTMVSGLQYCVAVWRGSQSHREAKSPIGE